MIHHFLCLGVKHLETLVQQKTQKRDEKLSKAKKADLKRRWEEIKGRESPQVSPYNTENEEDEKN